MRFLQFSSVRPCPTALPLHAKACGSASCAAAFRPCRKSADGLCCRSTGELWDNKSLLDLSSLIPARPGHPVRFKLRLTEPRTVKTRITIFRCFLWFKLVALSWNPTDFQGKIYRPEKGHPSHRRFCGSCENSCRSAARARSPARSAARVSQQKPSRTRPVRCVPAGPSMVLAEALSQRPVCTQAYERAVQVAWEALWRSKAVLRRMPHCDIGAYDGSSRRTTSRLGCIGPTYLYAIAGTAQPALRGFHRRRSWPHDSFGSTAGRTEQLADGAGSTPRQAVCKLTARPHDLREQPTPAA
jgi:hypothetical protein